MWSSGLFECFPPAIDHATVAVESAGAGRVVFMHDVSDALVPDWGERTGTAPPAVELASFLAFDARRLDVSRDNVIADLRALYGDRFEETALQLALTGGMVQLGCHFVLDLVLHGGDTARESAIRELAWWTEKVAAALEIWSPV